MITLCVLGFLYFLPTVVAHNRGHELAGVLLLNLFFGWTGIGWVALLLWAALSWAPYDVVWPATYYRAPVVYYPPPVYYFPPSWRRL